MVSSLFFRFAVIILVFAAGINPARAETAVILAVGDSLTAGLGLPQGDAFPARLEAALKEKGLDVKVVNAGVSGETSSGTKARIEWTLEMNPGASAVILETGGNDMLRGIDPAITSKNIRAILDILKKRDLPVLLAGMHAFTNLGAAFTFKYRNVFSDLADEYDTLFYPFFLEGVAMNPELMQQDGMHPNAAGVNVVVRGILPDTEKLIEKSKAK